MYLNVKFKIQRTTKLIMASSSSIVGIDEPKLLVTTTHKFQAPEIPISAVTVYRDRAEVKRNVGLKLDAGLNRVIIEYVAKSIIVDSIRVDGTGKAVIHEVQFKDEQVDVEVENPKGVTLHSQKKELNERKKELEDTEAVIAKQLNALNEMLTSNFGKPVLGQGNQIAFDSGSEQSLEMLYGFHERKCKQLNERKRKDSQEIKELDPKRVKLGQELAELVRKEAHKKSISIDLQNGGNACEQVQLVVTYQVHRASWLPSYDVRANLLDEQPQDKARKADDQKEKADKSSTIRINYFGMIRQNTGESWENVQLTLSTAQPICGRLPRLGTTYAEFQRPTLRSPMGRQIAYQRTFESCDYATWKPDRDEDEDEADGIEVADGIACDDMGTISVEETQAREQVLLTTFEIAQPKTIPDDGSEHKVTIAQLDLPFISQFECLPSKNTNVFMTASIGNSSKYPLLAGLASIYLDNSFIQKGQIDTVVSGGKFQVPLGVFPSLKVKYKPANKFHRETGFLSKSSNLVNKQKIVVKNNGQKSVLLTIMEPIPKATDEKIKIPLPVISTTTADQADPKYHTVVVNRGKSGSINRSPTPSTTLLDGGSTVSNEFPAGIELKPRVPGAQLNADNNLEWSLAIDGGKEVEMVVKWEVEHPPNETVEFKEKFEN